MEKISGLSPEARDRLRQLVDASGGPTVVAAGSGVPKSTLDKYLGGHSEPPAGRLASVARFCKSTVEWIIYGEAASPDLMQMSSRPIEDYPDLDALEMIPRLNVRASAGLGLRNNDVEVAERVPFSSALLRRLGVAPRNAHIIQAGGDSMEETIADGDDVLIDMGDTSLKAEGIYAVAVGDLAMIKRVQPFAMMDSVTLISDNPRYPPTTIKRGEQDQFRVIGRAKLVMRVL